MNKLSAGTGESNRLSNDADMHLWTRNECCVINGAAKTRPADLHDMHTSDYDDIGLNAQ